MELDELSLSTIKNKTNRSKNGAISQLADIIEIALPANGTNNSGLISFGTSMAFKRALILSDFGKKLDSPKNIPDPGLLKILAGALKDVTQNSEPQLISALRDFCVELAKLFMAYKSAYSEYMPSKPFRS
jgi:hypothetical protein